MGVCFEAGSVSQMAISAEINRVPGFGLMTYLRGLAVAVLTHPDREPPGEERVYFSLLFIVHSGRKSGQRPGGWN